jgi:hypothetical protein
MLLTFQRYCDSGKKGKRKGTWQGVPSVNFSYLNSILPLKADSAR